VLYKSLFNIRKKSEEQNEVCLKEPPETSIPVTSDSKQKILIVEDSAMNLLLAKTLTAKILPGALILEARNGKEAVQAFEQQSPSLILMDVQMPEMDGIEATRQIREREKNTGTQTPIIALTAGAIKEEREKALASGMNEFLTKPIDAKKLQETLFKFLEGCFSAPPRSQNPVKDGSAHFDLKACMEAFDHNRELMNELLQACKTDFPENLARLKTAIGTKQLSSVLLSTHSLKGLAMNMRFNLFASLASELETLAKEENYPRLTEIFKALEEEWQNILPLLKPIE